MNILSPGRRLAACALWVLATQAATAGTSVRPPSARTSDSAVARDLRLFDSWQARLDSTRDGVVPHALYRRVLAQAWLDMARAEYGRDDGCGIVDSLLSATAAAVRSFEQPDTSRPLPAPPITGQDRPGEKYWGFAARVKDLPEFKCVEAEVAHLECTLVRAAHEQREGVPCESNEYLQAASLLGDEIRKKAQACRPPAPVAVAPKPLTVEEKRQIESLPKFVHFALDSASIGPKSRAILAGIAKTLVAIPQIRIQIEGHADKRASEDYNMNLSKRRAYSVRAFLSRAGVAAERIETMYYGKSRPHVQGDDIETFARNRCVIFTYLPPPAVQIQVTADEKDLQLEDTKPAKPRDRQ